MCRNEFSIYVDEVGWLFLPMLLWPILPCVRHISLPPGGPTAALDSPCLAETVSERSAGNTQERRQIFNHIQNR